MSTAFSGHSITRRLTLLFALVSAVMLALLGIATLWALDAHFKAEDRITLARHLQSVASVVTGTDTASGLAALPKHLQTALINHDDLALNVATSSGTLVYRRGFHNAPPPVPVSTASEVSTLSEWSDNGRNWRGASVRLAPSVPEAQALIVTIALDLHHHQTFTHNFRTVLLGYLLLCALGCAVAGAWAVRRGLQPLTALRERAAQVQPGQLDLRMPEVDVPVELVGLSRTLNQMLARLEDAFRRLSQFSSDIAHELRTPISNMMTQTQVTLSQPRTAAEYRETLASNSEELERLSRTVSDMLFLAKADHGLLLPSREPVALHTEIQALLEFYEILALEKNVLLHHEGDASVMGDRLMLRRAIGNLLSNALQHTPAGGSIKVHIEADQNAVGITVRNDGQPIDTQALPHVFDRFYRAQADRAHSPNDGEGAGLGLAITQAIVASHGGTIQVKPLTAGTEFSIRIPVLS